MKNQITIFVSEDIGCRHFHPYSCGKVVAPCPVSCQRKAAHDDYEGSDVEDSVTQNEHTVEASVD